MMRDDINELVKAWNSFYLALPDGEYKGLGELRAAVRNLYASQFNRVVAESRSQTQKLQKPGAAKPDGAAG